MRDSYQHRSLHEAKRRSEAARSGARVAIATLNRNYFQLLPVLSGQDFPEPERDCSSNAIVLVFKMNV